MAIRIPILLPNMTTIAQPFRAKEEACSPKRARDGFGDLDFRSKIVATIEGFSAGAEPPPDAEGWADAMQTGSLSSSVEVIWSTPNRRASTSVAAFAR